MYTHRNRCSLFICSNNLLENTQITWHLTYFRHFHTFLRWPECKVKGHREVNCRRQLSQSHKNCMPFFFITLMNIYLCHIRGVCVCVCFLFDFSFYLCSVIHFPQFSMNFFHIFTSFSTPKKNYYIFKVNFYLLLYFIVFL